MREIFWQEVIWVSRYLYTKWENTKKMDIAVIMCINKQENIYLADFLIENANSYYRGLAAYYKKHNDMETAVKTVLEGLDKADGRLDGI